MEDGGYEVPAEVAVGSAIDLVTSLRDVCALVDPELASECGRCLGSLWALAARVVASGSTRVDAMMGIRVRPTRAVLDLEDLMCDPAGAGRSTTRDGAASDLAGRPWPPREG